MFIDFERCFDKINRAFLRQKLLSQNVSTKITKAIQAMYSVVKSVIKHQGSTSDPISSYMGVKQGDASSVFSPTFTVLWKDCIVEKQTVTIVSSFNRNLPLNSSSSSKCMLNGYKHIPDVKYCPRLLLILR